MAIVKENKIAILALTRGGASLGIRLFDKLPSAEVYLPERLRDELANKHSEITFFSDWKKTAAEIFATYREIIFIMATGIVVRSIAPLLKNKREDPAVVVIDEKGRFPISLLSGHMGGANRLCSEVAEILGVEPVITTATDVNGRAAVDTLAKKLGCQIEDFKKVKYFNRLLAEGEIVGLYTMWPQLLENINTKGFYIRPWVELEKDSLADVQGAVVITNRNINPPQKEHLFLYPENLVVGVGCRRGVPGNEILNAIKETFDKFNLRLESVKMLASIDLKAEEEGLLQTAEVLGIPFKTIPAEEIARLEGTFQESDFVKKITGVGGVCEPAARILSRRGKIVVPKQKLGRVTVAVAEEKFML